MENIPAQSPVAPLPPARAAAPVDRLPLETFAPALGDATRWRIVAALAEGEPLMVSELAARLGRSPGLISKHIARLREAGLVEVGRARLYKIPARFLQTPGVADYGHCQISASQKAG